MHSSFLTFINAGLALSSLLLFFKLVLQFGLPNHPLRFTAYMVSFCVCSFFVLETITALGLMSPLAWLRWRPFPLVCGSLGLFLQAVTCSGSISLVQKKIFSRMPLIAGLLCFAFFPGYADVFVAVALVAGGAFLSVSVGKARYQKRAFFKMCLFLALAGSTRYFQIYWVYNLGQVFLFFALFYFFLFEHAFGISALVEDLEAFDEKAQQ